MQAGTPLGIEPKQEIRVLLRIIIRGAGGGNVRVNLRFSQNKKENFFLNELLNPLCLWKIYGSPFLKLDNKTFNILSVLKVS